MADFVHKIRVRRVIGSVAQTQTLYPHNVAFYNRPPQHDITLQEFEELAFERLNLLSILEKAGVLNTVYSAEWRAAVVEALNAEKLTPYVRLIENAATTTSSSVVDGARDESELLGARQRDYVSHFILRIAFCKSEELRRWFVAREMELFRIKFAHLAEEDIHKFLALNHLKYEPCAEQNIAPIKPCLYDSTAGSRLELDRMHFYKVPFTLVTDLVALRSCFLKRGFAYVSSSDFASIVASHHETNIEDGLKRTRYMLPTIERDERIAQLCGGLLDTSYAAKDFAVAGQVPTSCLDQLSKTSFPLCMRASHEHLRTTHHHKYQGRLQYNLFLKGIGVTMEDALRFWQHEFTKTMDTDTFQKKYAYTFRHSYGREGSHINYTPYSCETIINERIGPLDTHGCPYMTWDSVALRTRLTDYGLSAVHVDEVVRLADKDHPQLACGRYFEVTMDQRLAEDVTHPNVYYEMCKRIMATRCAAQQTDANTAGAKEVVTEVFNDDELWKVSEAHQPDRVQQASQLLEDSL